MVKKDHTYGNSEPDTPPNAIIVTVTHIEKLNDEQFGLCNSGRIVAVFDSFKDAKLIQLMTFLKELNEK